MTNTNRITSKEALVTSAKKKDADTSTPIERLKKPTLEKKSKRGGARPGSGRKTLPETLERRGVKEMLEEHIHQEVEVVYTNKKTGETVIKKKPAFVAVLDMLLDKAIKAKDTAAAKEYYDRTIGKPFQQLAMKHSGEVGTYTAKKPTPAALAAKRAYEREQYGVIPE